MSAFSRSYKGISLQKLNIWLLAAAAALMLALAGCGGDSGGGGGAADAVTGGNPSLVATSTVAAGDADCPGGGILVESGIDTSGDGVLDADEVTSEEKVCNGTGTAGADGADGAAGAGGAAGAAGVGTDGSDGVDGLTGLTATMDLPLGDVDCPMGGVEISFGIDDDRDGVLGIPDEVDSVEIVCNGTVGGMPSSWDKPEGPAPQYTAIIAGGNGTTGAGGYGGSFDAYYNYGEDGSHIKLFDTGQADAGFIFPAAVNNLGSDPLTAASGTVTVYNIANDTTTHDPAGDFHTHGGDIAIYSDIAGTSEGTTVTGIKVEAGATLEFENNNNITPTFVIFTVSNDVVNLGAIRTIVSANNRPNLSITANGFYGGPNSLMEMSGADNGAGAGGSGGSIIICLSGAFLNQGDFETFGGSATGTGATGGSGGNITSSCGDPAVFINTGNMDSSGGAGLGATDSGGTAGDIYVLIGWGMLANSGNMTANGGNGAAAGGDSGHIDLETDNGSAPFLNSGNLTANGGDGGTGAGGDASVCCNSTILLYSHGDLINSGDLTARGGSGGTSGGTGGSIYFDAKSNQDWGYYEGYNDIGSLVVSGNLDASGGDGATSGGSGGSIELYQDMDYIIGEREIIMLGYQALITDGGSGTSGGDAGTVTLFQNYAEGSNADYTPAGGIFNHIPIFARGGDGSTTNGGDGGDLDWYTYYELAVLPTDYERLENHAPIDISGGTGNTAGGNGGNIYWWGKDELINTGDINMSGGEGVTAGGTGCGGIPAPGAIVAVSIGSQGWVFNEGSFNGRGGDSTGAGGTAGGGCNVEIVGAYGVATNGDFDLSGGDDVDGGSGTGGAGGDLFLLGQREFVEHTGIVIINGGSGNTGGADGTVTIDTQDYTEVFLP